MKLRTSLLAGVVALLSVRTAQAQKNVLVVIADDLGVEKVSSYAGDYAGYTPTFLPNTLTIDTLASRGLRFTHAWATPECTPTRISLMTGVHPSRHGIGRALGNGAAGMDWSTWIDPVTGRSTLAQEFADRGYTTGLFGKSHYGNRNEDGTVGVPAVAGPLTTAPNPIVAGFDRFTGSLDGVIGDYTDWWRVRWLKGGTGRVDPETTHATRKTEEAALDWISTRTEPWLAVVSFNAPHSGASAGSSWTYDDVSTTSHRSASLDCLDHPPPDPLQCAAGEVTQKAYQALVEDMDLKLRTLLNGIDQTVLENTLIVFMGDNGTPSPVEESVFVAAPARGKGTTYESGVRVPLVIADGYAWVNGNTGPAPIISSINEVIAAKVNTVDLYNTLLDFAFATTNPMASDSSSFTQCFTQASDPNHWCGWTAKRYGYTEWFTSNASPNGARAAVSYGLDTMVVTGWNAGANCFNNEFYDGTTDPLQTTAVTWAGIRSQRLRDHFNSIHAASVDWANPGGAVRALCN
jgi:arylsulfatase B